MRLVFLSAILPELPLREVFEVAKQLRVPGLGVSAQAEPVRGSSRIEPKAGEI